MEEQAAAGGGTAEEGEGRGIRQDIRGKGDRRRSFRRIGNCLRGEPERKGYLYNICLVM